MSATAGVHELSAMAIGYESSRLQVRVEGESSEALVTLRAVSVLDQPKAGVANEGLATFGYYKSVSDPAMTLSLRAEQLQSVPLFDSAAAAWAPQVASADSSRRTEARY